MTHSGMQIARLSPTEALDALGSDMTGLPASEALRRLAAFGPNGVQAVKRAPWWLNLLREFTHFFALILWLAALLAFGVAYRDPGYGMLEMGVAIVGVILLNGGFSFWQTFRAEQALAALEKLLPQQVRIRRDGIEADIPAAELVPGDIIQVAEGTKVPADCRLIESWGLRVNLSTLTGESYPKTRSERAEQSNAPDSLNAHCLLLAGTLIVSGEATAMVFATGMNTEFGRIAHLTQFANDTESPLQIEIRRVSRLLALLALGLGVLFFLFGQAIGLNVWVNLMFTIGIIVANVPEGLLPTVTLSLALATQRMAKRNALVRHLPAVETMGCATVILTDKTGTLTQNRMQVREWFAGGQHHLASDRWPAARDVHLRAVARFCQSIKFSDGHPSGDPMEIALWQFAGEMPTRWKDSGEIAFDADRRRMSVYSHEADGGGTLLCKGAPENVFPLCKQWIDGHTIRPFDANAKTLFYRAHDDLTNRGLRVLACAWRPLVADEVPTEDALILCGLIGLEDPPRSDVHQAVQRCHEAGLKVIMVTGDHPRTALALGREIDMIRSESPLLLIGEAVRDMSAAELQIALDAPEIIFARVSAEQKMLIVQALQRKGEIVAVTGDGVNDAPALRMADIGIAMGLSGTDVAREAADIVLLDDHFGSIVNAIEEGRAVYDNIRKFITYILTSNIPELIPYLAFILFRIPLPLTVIQILAVDLGTDMLPALALGAEKPSPDVMKRPPRPRAERLLSGGLLARAYLFLGPLEALGAMATFFFVLHGMGWQYGETFAATDPRYMQATSACFIAIVLAQMVNLFVCRHPRLAAWEFSLFENPWLIAGLVSEAGLLIFIIYTPWGNQLFGTVPLSPAVFLYALPFAIFLGVAEETRKWGMRRCG